MKKVCILLVDDNVENLMALSAILDNTNYDLVLARSGQEALRAVLLNDFALILLDVRMPDLDGFEVARILKSRQKTRGIPIIFLTAEASEIENVFRGYSVGAVDYMQKPLEPRIVRAKVSIFAELYLKNAQLLEQAQKLIESERRQRELELAALKSDTDRRYRELANAIPHIVWTADSEGNINYFNRRWYQYSGFDFHSSEEADVFSKLIHPSDYAEFENAWKRALSREEEVRMECRLRRAFDNQFRWHLCRIHVERDQNNAHIGWIGSFTDIHEQKSADRAKDEFLATLSHELRTPLNVILGWVDLLQSDAVEEHEFRNVLSMMDRNVRVLITLIDDLLDVSRIITGKLLLKNEAVCMKEVVGDAMRLLTPSANEKKILIETSTPTGRVEVKGDPERLKQVVWNILSNAIKFTHNDGHVQIELSQVANMITLSVKDNGQGIAPEFLPSVFNKFVQEDSSTTRKQGGLGLGLAIVRQLVELHGGTVNVHSDGKGKGSTFTVTLPALAASESLQLVSREPEQKRAALKNATLKDLAGVRVLLVDDSPDVRLLLKRILQRKGAEVTCTSCASEALKQLGEDSFDILLSDIGMPEKDGYTFIQEVRSTESYTFRNIPAIALTAYAREEERKRAIDAGFQMHVSKPVDASVLTRAVADMVQQRH